jgi:hypothetical protein
MASQALHLHRRESDRSEVTIWHEGMTPGSAGLGCI